MSAKHQKPHCSVPLLFVCPLRSTSWMAKNDHYSEEDASLTISIMWRKKGPIAKSVLQTHTGSLTLSHYPASSIFYYLIPFDSSSSESFCNLL